MSDTMKLALRYKKEIIALEKENAELAEAAEQMLEMLVNNAPIEGLYPSTIDEWDVMIKNAKEKGE